MRTTARAIGLIVVSLIASVALGLASAFTAAFAFGATALIVPGTGTPNATNVGQYMENARDYYMGGTKCADGGCTDADLHSIVYPASFYPLSFIPGWCDANCQKWDVSVQDGVNDLHQQLLGALADPNEHIVIFGYSQGGAVVSNELRALGTTLTTDQKARIEVVMIGNIDNPLGGLWTLLGFLGHVPILDVTTGLPTPVNTGIPFKTIVFQYDGVSNSPIAWGNLLAVANAFAGFAQIHGTYLRPNQNSDFTGLPDGYTEAELQAALNDPANIKTDVHGNQYVTIPTKVLPLASLILSLANTTGTTQIVKPFVSLLSPIARVLIDLAYDPNADPSVPRGLTILPFAGAINPIKLAFDLAAATVQGIQAFLNDLGFATVAPATTAPVTTSTLAARTIAPQAVDPQADASESLATVTALSSVKKSTPAVTETDAVEVTNAVPAEATEATTPATQPAASEKTPPATDVDAATKPEPTKPEKTKPEPTTPESTTPESTKPETTKPAETTKPETTKPETTKPDKKDATEADKKDAAGAAKKDASDADTKAAA